MTTFTSEDRESATRNTRPLVIYHGNCADGFAAAWCFWKHFGDDADYVAGVYQKEPPDVTNRDVYLVDFSYKREVMGRIVLAAKHVWLIDHHKSALEDLADMPHLNYFTSLDNSGAMLAWNFLNPGVLPPMLLQHIEDRDLWRFELPYTREIQAALFSYPYAFEVWDELINSDLILLIEQGAAIERKHFKDINELLAFSKRRVTIGGVNVPVANLPYTMSSDAGHIMAKGEPFAVCYMDKPDGREFSLRSAPDGMDVSEVAKQFGGGGHKHAAGFRVPRDHELARF